MTDEDQAPDVQPGASTGGPPGAHADSQLEHINTNDRDTNELTCPFYRADDVEPARSKTKTIGAAVVARSSKLIRRSTREVNPSVKSLIELVGDGEQELGSS